MTALAAQCPNCGAAVEFRWAGAVQTTCAHCTSILVRHGVDLERVGQVSEPPPTDSPIQLGTQGSYRGRPFTVVGRLVYEYERGAWSEWHVVFGNGDSGWLSDAQRDYAMTSLVAPEGELPGPGALLPGATLRHGGTEYVVSAVTPARYVATEGELPFEYWDHDVVPFADLRSADGRFLTVDYSETPPLLFAGEHVALKDLKPRNLREETARSAGPVGGLNCPSCGNAIALRDPEHAVTVVCDACLSVLDATDPETRVLQKVGKKTARHKPKIPLGTVGRLHGAEWQAIGFQVRTITVDGVDYSWDEYLLSNRTEGYRYLTEYDGHWNDVVTLKSVPALSAGNRPTARLNGETFRHFQHATPRTTFVLGEFPWEVRFGDRVKADDYVSPPRMLSREVTDAETTWSLGEYTPGDAIWKAFGLPGEPPLPVGVFANQPSPHGSGNRRTWKTFGILFALFVLAFFVRVGSGDEQVHRSRHAFLPGDTTTHAVVTQAFDVAGRPSDLEVTLDTDLSNGWAYFDVTLIDEASGRAWEVGRNVSYYFGTDGGESWSEGSKDDRFRLGGIPAGRYFLRLAPQGEEAVSYSVTVKRDVTNGLYWLLALLALVAPAVLGSLRSAGFEGQRWAESDYASTESDDDD